MGETYDINDYYKTFPAGSERDTIHKQGKFIKFQWLDISDWKLDDPRLEQVGVKAEQNSTEKAEEMAHAYEVSGWDMGSFPPSMGMDGRPRNGRTRIRAGIMKKQKFIASAHYNFPKSNTPTKDFVTAGLTANVQKPSTRSTGEDFIVGAIASIDAGDLARNENEIMYWLVNEAQIEERFANTKGFYTRIVNTIIDRTADKNNLTLVKDSGEWELWLEKSNYNIKNLTLLKANPTNSIRFWCNSVLSLTPRDVVLYSDSFSPSKASAAVEEFVDKLEWLYKQSYKLVNLDLAGGPLNLTPPLTRPYNILGVCPSLKRGDQPQLFEDFELVSTKDFIHNGSGISSALQLVS